MVLCCEDCIPCCDYCIFCIHIELHGGPIGCSLHKDMAHQETAESCGWCMDFNCVRAKEKEYDL